MASLARVTVIASRWYCSRKPSSRVNCGLPVAVEMQVFLDAVAACRHRRVDGSQGCQDALDRRFVGTLGRQRRHFTFQRAAHLDDLHHRFQRVQHGRVKRQRLGTRHRRHIDARTLTRHQQPHGLEPAHRLAHHGARHAVALGQFLFGGQAILRTQLAAFDASLQQVGQPVGQAVGRQQGLGRGRLSSHQVIIQI
jgi:hypothetical protein